MNIITTFNPIVTASGTFDMTIQNGGHLLVTNESSANLILTFGNGASTYVPANDKRLYCINGQMAQPHTKITYSTQSTLPNQNIVNQTVIEAFQPGENVPETYPSPIIRNTSVAGAIKATGVQLIDASPLFTTVISAIDSTTGLDYLLLVGGSFIVGNNSVGGLGGSITLNGGSGSSEQTIINGGSINIRNVFTDGITPLAITDPITSRNYLILLDTAELDIGDNGAGGQFGSLKIAGPITVNGNYLSVDTSGLMTVPNAIHANLIRAIIPTNAVGQDLGLHVPTTGYHIVSTVEGAGDIFKVGAEGASLLQGTLALLTGSISRISMFGPYTLSTTATFFNHNLGVVPDMVLLQIVGAASTAEMAKYDNTSMTTTQVKLVSNGSYKAVGLAIKF